MRRRQKGIRRARQSVLGALAVFVITQMALSVAEETLCPRLRSPAFGARLDVLHRQLPVESGRPLILALGSSRVETGLHPAAFGDSNDDPWTFNFGLAGSGPISTWLTFRHLDDLGIRPSRVVLEIMPALLFDPRPAEQCVFAEKLTLADLRRLAPECNDSSAPFWRWAEARALPIYSSRFAIMSRLAPRWMTWDTRQDYLWANLDRYGANRLPDSLGTPTCRSRGADHAEFEYRERLRNYRIDSLPSRMVRRLLENCRDRSIPVLLLLMPESPAFQAMYSADAMPTVEQFFAELQRDFAVEILNARSWLPETAFLDGHHLLESGAASFSARFAGETRSWRSASR